MVGKVESDDVTLDKVERAVVAAAPVVPAAGAMGAVNFSSHDANTGSQQWQKTKPIKCGARAHHESCKKEVLILIDKIDHLIIGVN